MRRECYDFISQVNSYAKEGLPDDIAEHVENCPACRSMLETSGGRSAGELRALWRAKEPERKAQELFRKDCNDWYETWRGKIYLLFGGPFWSRRATWLGIPRWEKYKPASEGLSKTTC